jgi:potassium-dependent mechanosensitive channel
MQQLWSGLSNIFGAPLFQLGESAISLGSIVQFVLALLLVIYLMRVLRLLLAKRLLARFNIDAHNREVIATIISYSIGALGLIVILQSTGFNIASLAVLAGGLGVGIGLGLQSLTVNFFSGMTILLSRKIRVGDYITFDGLEGYIQEVSLQSTILRTRDGYDVIVPNRSLTEYRVVNWSYDSYTARIHMPFGVAYGSDLVLVTEAVLDCAYAHPHVVLEPPPKVIFLGLGNHALDLELRVWINQIDLNPDIRSDLYFAIEEALRLYQIEVPFTQIDLRLRRSPQLGQPSRLQAARSDEAEIEQLLESFSGKHDDAIATTQSMGKAPKPMLVAERQSLKALLQAVDYFQQLSDLQLRQLIESGYRQQLEPEAILFREGDPGNAFYVVLRGRVEVFSEKANKSLSQLGPGRSFGELSLILGIPRSASVRALEATNLFVINHSGFQQLISQHPKIYEAILKEFERHQEELAERQQQLREMGLIDSIEDDRNLTLWVRKRLQRLFNLQNN